MAESKPMALKERLALELKAFALKDAGKEDEAHELFKQVPISPALARVWVTVVGKEAFLKEGYNLYEVEQAFGKDWVTT